MQARFAIRLKRLQPRSPMSRGPKILGLRTISSISVSNYICTVLLFWFNARFFTLPLTKDLYGRMRAQRIEVKDVEHSLFMALGIVFLLRIICGTKRLNPFSDYTRSVKYSINMQWVCGQISSTAAFVVSLIVTVFVADIAGIENELIYL